MLVVRETYTNCCLYMWLAVPPKSRELQCREVNICINLSKLWVILANSHLSFVLNKTPSFHIEFSPQKKHPVRWTSQLGPDVVTQSSEKHTAPRSSFPFPFPCCVLSFFFFPIPLLLACTRVEQRA